MQIPKITNIEGTTNRQIRITLSPGSDSNIIGYKFYIDNKLSQLNIRPINSSNIYTLDYDGYDNELEYGVPYIIQVLSYSNSDESPLSEQISATTIYGRPNNPQVTFIKGYYRSIHIKWIPNNISITNPTEGYHIYIDDIKYTIIGRDISSYIIDNLIIGQTYTVKVFAYSASKLESIDPQVYRIFPRGYPNMPLNLNVTPSPNTGYRFLWNAPIYNNVYPIDGYILKISGIEAFRLDRTTDKQTFTTIQNVYRKGITQEMIDNNIIPSLGNLSGQNYAFYAYSDVGESEYINGSFVQWISDIINLSGNYLTNYHSLMFNWTNLSQIAWSYPIIGIRVRYYKFNTLYKFRNLEKVAENFRGPLKYGDTIRCEITAFNEFDDERPALIINHTHTLNPIPVKSYPISDSSIYISWQPPQTLWNESVKGYRIYSTADFVDSTKCLLYEISGNIITDISNSSITSYIINSINPITDKYYLIPYNDTYKCTPASYINIGDTLKIKNFRGTAGVNCVRLDWSAVNVNGFSVHGYEVLIGKGSIFVKNNYYTDFRVEHGYEYIYKVRVIGIIPGPFSDEIKVIPKKNTEIPKNLFPSWNYQQSDFKINRIPTGFRIIPNKVISIYDVNYTNTQQTSYLGFKLIEVGPNNIVSYDNSTITYTTNTSISKSITSLDNGILLDLSTINSIQSPQNRLYYKGENTSMSFMLYPIDYNNNESLQKPIFSFPGWYSDTKMNIPSIDIQLKSVTVNWQIRQNVWDDVCLQYIIVASKYDGSTIKEYTFREYGANISLTKINLDAGKYKMKISAVNGYGDMLPFSDETTEFIIFEAPLPVKTLIVESLYNSILLKWQKPDITEYNKPLKYKVLQNGYIIYEINAIDNQLEYQYTVSNTIQGIQYLYSIVASNLYGDSPIIIEKSGRSYPIPNRPTNVRVESGDGCVYINVEWMPQYVNYKPSGFALYRILSGGGDNASLSFYKNIGLDIERIEQQNGELIRWRIYSLLNGIQSTEYYNFDAMSYQTPNRVSNLSAINTNSLLKVSWTKAQRTLIAPLKGYTIYLDGVATITLIDILSEEYIFSGLDANAQNIEIISNGADNMHSISVQCMVQNGQPITNLISPYRESHQVYLEWDSYDEAIGYNIYKDGTFDGFSLINKYASMNLSNGRKYSFMVQGIRQDGTLSLISNIIEISPENVPVTLNMEESSDMNAIIKNIKSCEVTYFEQLENDRIVRLIFDPVPSIAINKYYNPFQTYIITSINGLDPISTRSIMTMNAKFSAPSVYFQPNSYYTIETYYNKSSGFSYNQDINYFPIVDGIVNQAIDVSYARIDVDTFIITWKSQLYLGQSYNGSLKIPVIGYNIYIVRDVDEGAIEKEYTLHGVNTTSLTISNIKGNFYCIVTAINGYGDETQKRIAKEGAAYIEMTEYTGEIAPYMEIKQKDLRIQFKWEPKYSVFLEPVDKYILYKMIDEKQGVQIAEFDSYKHSYDISMINEYDVYGLTAITETGIASPLCIKEFRGVFPPEKAKLYDSIIQLTVNGRLASGSFEFYDVLENAIKYQITDEYGKIIKEGEIDNQHRLKVQLDFENVISNQIFKRKVQLFNAGGSSPISDEIQFISPILPIIPQLGYDMLLGAIRLRWLDIGSTAQNYILYYTIDDVMTQPQQQIVVDGHLREYIISGVNSEHIYRFQIAVKTAVGFSAKSAVLTCQAGKLPNDAVNLAVTGKNNSLTLRWLPPTSQPINTSALEYILHQTVAGDLLSRKTYRFPYGATSYIVNVEVGVYYNFHLQITGALGTTVGITNGARTTGISLNRITPIREGELAIDIRIIESLLDIEDFEVFLNNKQIYVSRSIDVSYPNIRLLAYNLKVGAEYKVQARILYKSGSYSPISNSLTVMVIGSPAPINFIGGGMLFDDNMLEIARQAPSHQKQINIIAPSLYKGGPTTYTNSITTYSFTINNVSYFIDYNINTNLNGRPITNMECRIVFSQATISGLVLINEYSENIVRDIELGDTQLPMLPIVEGNNRIKAVAATVTIVTASSRWSGAQPNAAQPAAFFEFTLSNQLGTFTQRYPFTAWRKQNAYSQLTTSAINNAIKLTWNIPSQLKVYNYQITKQHIYRNNQLIATISGVIEGQQSVLNEYVDNNIQVYSRYIYSIKAETLIGESNILTSNLVLFKAFAPTADYIINKVFDNVPQLTIINITQNIRNNDTQISSLNPVVGYKVYVNGDLLRDLSLSVVYPINVPMPQFSTGVNVRIKITTITLFGIESDGVEKVYEIPEGVLEPDINVNEGFITVTGNNKINGFGIRNGNIETRYNIVNNENKSIKVKEKTGEYYIYGFYQSGGKYIESRYSLFII